MERVSKKDLKNMEDRLEKKYGFRKYQTQGRYGYTGIDEYDEKGGCLRTHRTGLTKKEAYFCLYDLLCG